MNKMASMMMNTTEAAVATIKAMRHQEEKTYMCGDYLFQQQQELVAGGIPTIGPLTIDSVTVECREKMVQWCYKVVDFCSFNRETVSVAMSILDRFLASPGGRPVVQDRSLFQLAAMTCLYTAVKIHEPEVMSAELVSTLSRGAHTQREVEVMETRILQSLTWLVNPPTTLSFVREYMKLLPPELLVEPEMKSTLMEICKFQSELAVADYTLILVGTSTLAYASLMNALESLCMDRNILGYVSTILSQAAGINLFSDQLVHVQIRLCQAVAAHTQPAAPVAPVPVANNMPTTAAAAAAAATTVMNHATAAAAVTPNPYAHQACGRAELAAAAPKGFGTSPHSVVARMEI